jgi:hypothetical protein
MHYLNRVGGGIERHTTPVSERRVDLGAAPRHFGSTFESNLGLDEPAAVGERKFQGLARRDGATPSRDRPHRPDDAASEAKTV